MNERLKTKAEGSTRLAYTGLCGGLEQLKISGIDDEHLVGAFELFFFSWKEPHLRLLCVKDILEHSL